MTSSWRVVVDDGIYGEQVVFTGADEAEARGAYMYRAATMHHGQSTRLEHVRILNERRRP